MSGTTENHTTETQQKFSKKDTWLIPPEQFTIITDPNHPLYDERINLPIDKFMVANVKSFGVKEPIIAVRKDGQIVVIAGRQRVRWALAANEELVKEGQAPIKVPTLFERGDVEGMMGIMILENEVRREDDAITKAKKAQRLIDRGYSETDAAVAFGVSKPSLRNWLKLLDTTPAVQDAVERGDMPFSAALQLGELPADKQQEAVEKVKEARKNGQRVGAAEAAEVATEVAEAAGVAAPKAKDKAQASKAPKRGQLRNALKHVVDQKGDAWRIAGAVLSWVLGDTTQLKAEVDDLNEETKKVVQAIRSAGRKVVKKAKKTEEE